MDNTVYVGLSNQMALSRRLEVIANNIANMNTTAFKAERVSFREYLADQTATPVDGFEQLSFVYDVGVSRTLTEGDFVSTQAPLDFAIKGPGFFTVMTPSGAERYTRNGNFALNGTGVLVTPSGNPVLDITGNEILIDSQDGTFSVAGDGTITTSAGVIGRINVVKFSDEAGMEKLGESLFATTETPQPALNAHIEQGMLENSNVTPILEITNMIDVLRSYQETSRLLKDYEDLQRRTVQTLGNFS